MCPKRSCARRRCRRRQAGESAEEVAATLGSHQPMGAQVVGPGRGRDGEPGMGRGPVPSAAHLPDPTDDELRRSIIDARARLVLNPRAQYGPLAVAWELRRMGVDPIPPRWTIERVIAAEGLARPRRRQAGYVVKGVPYPAAPDPSPERSTRSTWSGPATSTGPSSSTP